MRYKKKPEIVDAMQFFSFNDVDCMYFCPLIEYNKNIKKYIASTEKRDIIIESGDWIVKDEDGNFSFFDNSSFQLNFEVDE